MITYNLSCSNLIASDILPNEDIFKTTERITARVVIPIKYPKKPTQYIGLDLYFLPCGLKTVEQLLLEEIPLCLSEKQNKVYEKNGAVVMRIWSNRKNLMINDGTWAS